MSQSRVFLRKEDAEFYLLGRKTDDGELAYVISRILPRTNVKSDVYVQLEIQGYQLKSNRVVSMISDARLTPVVFYTALVNSKEKGFEWIDSGVIDSSKAALTGKFIREVVKATIEMIYEELTKSDKQDIATRAKKISIDTFRKLIIYVQEEGKKYQVQLDKSISVTKYSEENPKIIDTIDKLNKYFEDYNALKKLYLKGLAGLLGVDEYAEFIMNSTSEFSNDNAEDNMRDLVVKIGQQLAKLGDLQLLGEENIKLRISIEKYRGDLGDVKFKFFGGFAQGILQNVFHESLKLKR